VTSKSIDLLKRHDGPGNIEELQNVVERAAIVRAGAMALAERELGAFMKAVTDSFGPGQARLAAEDWLDELDSNETLAGLSAYDCRSITIAAASRLAMRINAASGDSKVSSTPLHNCWVPDVGRTFAPNANDLSGTIWETSLNSVGA